MINVNVSDIIAFRNTSRNENDEMNKKRESIIVCLLNKAIPDDYFNDKEYASQWTELRDALNLYIHNDLNIDLLCEYKAILRAGRKYNYDFMIITENNAQYNIEFKFNASKVDDTPQFVSPMRPSQYLDSSYESYFWEKYLHELCKIANHTCPIEKDYLDQIHNNSPICTKPLQDLYYQGCRSSSKYTGDEKAILFYTYSNMVSKESITYFIENNNLDINKLTNYLQETQKDKIYMMYKDGKFYKEEVDMDKYMIVSYVKESSKYRYLCITKMGVELTILLRWKNGNGIAFPAFQISTKKNKAVMEAKENMNIVDISLNNN
uniref:Uncharacterized protein n=1 Tax=viral metagenome TaxID=1070528 RepID=A0A6C0LHE2_9ZZZZ